MEEEKINKEEIKELDAGSVTKKKISEDKKSTDFLKLNLETQKSFQPLNLTAVVNATSQSSVNYNNFEDRPKYVLLEKTKAMYTLMHPYLELFPKNERFTLGAKIENTLLDAIKLLVLQYYQQTNDERRKIVLELLSNFYILEVLLQQSATFRYLSYESFDRSMLLLREINSFALARYKNLGGKNEDF